MTPTTKSSVVAGVCEALDVSERRACRVLRWSRTSVRYKRLRLPDAFYRAHLVALSEQYPRFGYRRLHAMLRRRGIRLARTRVLRICAAAKLTVPRRRKVRPEREIERNPMRAATHINEGWALDFTSEQLVTGERFRILTIIDEFSREIVVSVAMRSFKARTVVTILREAIRQRNATPNWLRSDNGSEFVAEVAQGFLEAYGIDHERSRPGKPTDNARIESFHGRFRDEILDRTLFNTVETCQQALDTFAVYYNHERPHSSLDYATPAEFAADHQAVHSQLVPTS